MIKTQKKQLSSLLFSFLAVTLIIFPVCFLAYATFLDHSFFHEFIFGSILFLGFALVLQFRLLRKQAEVELVKQDYVEKMNLLDAEGHKHAEVLQAYRNKIIEYSHLKGLIEDLCGCFTLEETSRTLSTEVNRLFGHLDCTVILYLFQSQTGELGISLSQKGQMEINVKAKKGDIYDHWIVRHMKPLLLEDVKKDFRFDAEKIDAEEQRFIRSLMSVPLMSGDKTVGILRVDSQHENQFTAEDIRLLSTVADLGAVAIENAQLYERVEALAIKDGLTGVYLRRHMLERLSHELKSGLRRKKDVSFLMIDLDDFKKYNDAFGHTAGDILLKAIGSLLQGKFSDPRDIICRYGGEEFSIVLPDCPKKKALELAAELCQTVKKQTIILRRQETRITVSIGVATFPEDAQIKDELIQQADLALYKAKRQGKNRVVAAFPQDG